MKQVISFCYLFSFLRHICLYTGHKDNAEYAEIRRERRLKLLGFPASVQFHLVVKTFYLIMEIFVF
jgi:hypothetical protein